ncbi:LacI family DNA-binding transcriptional regulator [Streptomyces sp. CB01881]|uniref:LacI family DNA-binding transcriptional regulator n=1 Tax=Streptomyces sp. CB01881 TaxID=2078691 RepID=UPI000CDBC2F7|nr:LacI family DNA-binding transcriptional regulator [Streptomyces sp. CB01881]AUY53568.1 LacI family transcriptional regulator [Streptomyces sp. CB01881]TYC69712.1 LacI family transcriptional regulator [Streptomyces sp. CB01881]
MTSQPVTLLDVARAAGVSKSTASDALQGSGRVAEATRERVQAAARELGYRPNTAARSLRRSSTGAIGLHLPRTATRLDYYMNLAFGAVERAREDGLDLVLLAPGTASGGGLASRVDGLLVIDPEVDDPEVPDLLGSGVPVVTGERYLGGGVAPSGAVVCDNATSLAALLDHLAARGARRPALLAPGPGSDWAAALRAAATDWTGRQGVEVAVRTVPFAATPAEAEAATTDLLADIPGLDAVVCAPDGAVPGVLAAAAREGLQVGSDLLVAACVDGAAARGSSPQVTAVDLRAAEYGRECAALLSDLLSGSAQPGAVRRHDWALRIRASTAGRD